MRHRKLKTLDALLFLDNALAHQCRERGAVRSGLTQNVRLRYEPIGIPTRQPPAPSQRGDDRLLRGSATQRRRIGLAEEANPPLFARLRQVTTDAVDRRDGAGLFERGHDRGETAAERRSRRIETRLTPLGEQSEQPSLGRGEPAEIDDALGQPQIRPRAMRGARRQEEGEGVVEAAGALPRQPARGIELVGRNPRRWVDSGQQRLDGERRCVAVQARDHAEGGLAAQRHPNHLTHINEIAHVGRYAVAEQAIPTRPRAGDGDFGDRPTEFRRRDGVLRHAASLLVRCIDLSCPCRRRLRTVCCCPPDSAGDPKTVVD